MADDRDRVEVHLDSADLPPARPVGTVARERGRGRSVISFAYAPEWMATPGGFPLDPALPLFEGAQYAAVLPGIFADAAPDRWGRVLMERREAYLAGREKRRPRQLDEWDFLVGIDDRTRMGALRIAPLEEGPFLADERLPVPPVARLREMEHWAREAELGLSEEMSADERWLAMLVAPGSSLGGARPKANYLDGELLWIAKFPSREDRRDVGAWEEVAMRLAALAGVEVPETRLLSLGSPHSTFCAKRFDRAGQRRRLYASAMTLTGRRDNEDASYLDIARAIVDYGDPAAIDADLRQLFRRAVFNLMIANRDDHLRNHGFLRGPAGWRLAPAFDVNPTPEKLEHSLAFDDGRRLPELDVVRETAALYRLSPAEAEHVIGEVETAVAAWRDVAAAVGVSSEEIGRLAGAFLAA
ncbi:MAG TPA: type II toxin-antitoxin system HipA family toxin [Solirubrobacterales bacterium]|nr:type II toxin-antitoxin system HipA family toxin [Solirubrobacterales bacterium]